MGHTAPSGVLAIVGGGANDPPKPLVRIVVPTLHRRESWGRLCLALAALAIAGVAALTAWPAASALECEGIALDDGCLFTITGGDTDDPNDGFAVTNADGVPLWDFVRERDLQALGYPISQR